MKKIRYLLTASLFLVLSSTSSVRIAHSDSAPPSVELVPWASSESSARFESAEKADFFSLTQQFESQENKFYCGPTSAVIVLNALRAHKNFKQLEDPALYRGSPDTLPKKADQPLFVYDPVFARYTQDRFFNEETDKIKTQQEVFGASVAPRNRAGDYGFSLDQLAGALATYHLNVLTRHVSPETVEKTTRDEIEANLDGKHYVIVNYLRPALRQAGGGHISPLGAYDPKTDSFLILDVNATDQTWVWVKAHDLIEAMRTKDDQKASDASAYRGYVIISEGTTPTN